MTPADDPKTYVVFDEHKALIATGPASDVMWAVEEAERTRRRIQIFNDATGKQVSSHAELRAGARVGDEPRSPGRPKLGVVAREVTLLPRHWDWLAAQPGGASVALRKLVEAARGDASGEEAKRNARNAADRFMLGMAGDEPGFEEASRALYRGDSKSFEANIRDWPEDVRKIASRLAAPAFAKS